jgi:hypothetical protein
MTPMEINSTPIHLVRETTSWSKVLAENTFTTTSTETAGTTKLKSAQERAAAKRRKEMIKRRVPIQRVGLSTARGRRTNQWLLPICFILMLRRTFPATWANMAGINTAMVFFMEDLAAEEVMGFHCPNSRTFNLLTFFLVPIWCSGNLSGHVSGLQE